MLTLRTAHVLPPLIALALAVTGCPDNKPQQASSGCKADQDCKGNRVCVAGNCQDSPTPVTAQPPVTPPPTTPPPATPPPPVAPQPDPNAMAADGLPAVIPPPSSPVPSLAEWGAVPQEVRVSGSSARNCETKMLREWLRVTCRKANDEAPKDVKTLRSEGQQNFVAKAEGQWISTVIQVVQGKSSQTAFGWEKKGRGLSIYDLKVSWPSNAARPRIWMEVGR